MSKVPCSQCGVAILKETAQRNDGLCMPCKAGTRKSIEAGKRYRIERKEYESTNPFWKLWQKLVHQACETPEGFAGLSEEEKQYFAVGMLEGDVYNGGFDQYFYNSSGGYYKYALLGLKAMEAHQALELLQRAKQILFDFDEVPEDTQTRRKILKQRDLDSRTQRLETLDAQYWKDPDNLSPRCEAFARKHGLV